VVLTVWEPFIDVMTRVGAGVAYGDGIDLDEIDAEASGSPESVRRRLSAPDELA
jgi:hypothetical protein